MSDLTHNVDSYVQGNPPVAHGVDVLVTTTAVVPTVNLSVLVKDKISLTLVSQG